MDRNKLGSYSCRYFLYSQRVTTSRPVKVPCIGSSKKLHFGCNEGLTGLLQEGLHFFIAGRCYWFKAVLNLKEKPSEIPPNIQDCLFQDVIFKAWGSDRHELLNLVHLSIRSSCIHMYTCTLITSFQLQKLNKSPPPHWFFLKVLQAAPLPWSSHITPSPSGPWGPSFTCTGAFVGNSGVTAAGHAAQATGDDTQEATEGLKGNRLMEIPFISFTAHEPMMVLEWCI